MGSAHFTGKHIVSFIVPEFVLFTVDTAAVDLCIITDKACKFVEKGSITVAVTAAVIQHALCLSDRPAFGAEGIHPAVDVVVVCNNMVINRTEHLFAGHDVGVNGFFQDFPELLVQFCIAGGDFTICIEQQPVQGGIHHRISVLRDAVKPDAGKEKPGFVYR